MPRTRPGFDFTLAMRTLCADMASRLAELSHVDMDRVAVGICHARSSTPYGVYATLTPLRFAGGERERKVRGRRVAIERVADESGAEFLYLLNFYLPRFQDLPLEEKLTTVVHELWHIGERFDGDLRRHPGRCYAHGGSRRKYDAAMARLAQRWLAADPPPPRYEFLAANFAELKAEHGAVRGKRWRAPRLLPASG